MSDDKVEYKVVHGGRTLWWVEFATDCTISSLQVTGVPKKIDEEKEKGKQRERQRARWAKQCKADLLSLHRIGPAQPKMTCMRAQVDEHGTRGTFQLGSPFSWKVGPPRTAREENVARAAGMLGRSFQS
jgi:hypothetical protein